MCAMTHLLWNNGIIHSIRYVTGFSSVWLVLRNTQGVLLKFDKREVLVIILCISGTTLNNYQ